MNVKQTLARMEVVVRTATELSLASVILDMVEGTAKKVTEYIYQSRKLVSTSLLLNKNIKPNSTPRTITDKSWGFRNNLRIKNARWPVRDILHFQVGHTNMNSHEKGMIRV